MMSIKKILFIIIMLVSLTGCFYKSSDTYQPEKPDRIGFPYSDGIDLTLDDVIRLSEKGNNLEWSDFDGYSYYETGFGLCIRTYVINEKFCLKIGGAGTGLVAGYFHLETNDGNYIDIRTGDVKEFTELN